MYRDCPKKGNTSSTPACCNCQRAEGETAHPANYRGCRHAKEEMQKKKLQGKPKNTTGSVFSSTFIKPICPSWQLYEARLINYTKR
jgi:hypothetical protein